MLYIYYYYPAKKTLPDNQTPQLAKSHSSCGTSATHSQVGIHYFLVLAPSFRFSGHETEQPAKDDVVRQAHNYQNCVWIHTLIYSDYPEERAWIDLKAPKSSTAKTATLNNERLRPVPRSLPRRKQNNPQALSMTDSRAVQQTTLKDFAIRACAT